MKKNVLVVANVTATSDELVHGLVELARICPTAFTLLVPATRAGGGLAAARQTLQDALARLRGAGLEIDGMVGDSDPLVAVSEAWDPRRFDEIVLSTLPMRVSKWLHAGLPERIFRLTGVPVRHLVSEPAKPPPSAHPPPHADKGVLGPLSVLAWGRPREPDTGAGAGVGREPGAGTPSH